MCNPVLILHSQSVLRQREQHRSLDLGDLCRRPGSNGRAVRRSVTAFNAMQLSLLSYNL